MITKSKIPCVVVNANNPMAFAVIRSLGKRDVPVIAAIAKTHKTKNIYFLIKVSRFIKQKFYFNENAYEQNLIKCLKDIHEKINQDAALIPVDDDTMLMISKHREELYPLYRFIMPDHRMVQMLLDKYQFYRYAIKSKLPIPVTYLPMTPDDIAPIAKKIRYPCLIKPPWRRKCWYEHFGSQKVLVIDSSDELLKQSMMIFQFQKFIVIQEEIAGDDKHIRCSFVILDDASNPICIFICRKIRQYPPYKGDTSMAESCYDPEIERITLDVCKKLRLTGYISIEFKKDLRDHTYKIIEITPARINRQSGLSTMSGIDIPWIWYQTILKIPVRHQMTFRQGITWISEVNEIRSLPLYLKQKDISVPKLIQSYRHVKGFEVFDKTDLLPFLILLNQIVLRFLFSLMIFVFYPIRKLRG